MARSVQLFKDFAILVPRDGLGLRQKGHFNVGQGLARELAPERRERRF
jgi:hypothetical protein